MTTFDVSLVQTLAFVERFLPSPKRILDVGCGRGELAVALAGREHDVTAIDVVLPDGLCSAPGLRFVQCGFCTLDAAPFDALLFITSLHHITPLDEVVDRASRLLVPGGLLIAEEFSVEAPDAATAHWYYEQQEILAAIGRFHVDRIHGALEEEPLARWHAEHVHDEPLTEGRAMRAAIARRFELIEVSPGPYLYRYLAEGVRHSGAERDVVTTLSAFVLEAERRGIRDGSLVPIGLRLVGRRL